MKKAFESVKRYVQIYGVLVCAAPKERLLFDASILESSEISLITQEHLADAMEQLRHPPHPDKLMEGIDAKLAANASKLSPL